MIPVTSSNVAAVAYDNGDLTVEFHNGSRYQYHDVPETVYKGIFDAASVGQYLNGHIKGVYEFTRL